MCASTAKEELNEGEGLKRRGLTSQVLQIFQGRLYATGYTGMCVQHAWHRQFEGKADVQLLGGVSRFLVFRGTRFKVLSALYTGASSSSCEWPRGVV